jgi:hypothetical protein
VAGPARRDVSLLDYVGTNTVHEPVSDDSTPETIDAEAEADAEAAEARRRRTIIRLLVGFGIGIPVLIELATFVGLIEQSLLGGDEDDGGGETTPTPTGDGQDQPQGVGAGDELLPETAPRETLTVVSFRAGDDQWVFTLAAEVENTGSRPYTVQFGSVVTQAGERVEGQNRPVTVEPGETGQATGTWQLSPGARPDTVVVRTTTGDESPTDHEVDLGRVPLEGTRP